MNKKPILLLALSALIAGLVSFFVASSQPQLKQDQSNAAYERVMASKTLRCGYLTYPPVLTQDPNTKEFSGIAADVIEAIGSRLGLKIEWTHEFGFATSVTDLQTGRFDLTCIGFWRLPAEAPFVLYTEPFMYSQMNFYVRADDRRFDEDVRLLNQNEVRFISSDGQKTSSIVRDEFPNATLIELPNATSIAQQVEEVIAGKADIFLAESGTAEDYMHNNPNKLRKIPYERPYKVFQNTFALNAGEFQLKSMLDAAMVDLIENGEMDRILDKHDPDRKIFKRIAPNYQN
jgi:cyclohexadienyl dehydratase